mmetsp:Transcript_25518/g.29149  ORF Transcript_25518/g.29149 Transcript_25518/m.29149 type:complete len:532 (+) Transcript_25518:77-1672(+)
MRNHWNHCCNKVYNSMQTKGGLFVPSQPRKSHFFYTTSCKISRRQFHLSTYQHLSSKDNNHDSSKDWIPPQRPLSGDLGQSQVYATKTSSSSKAKTIFSNKESMDADLMETIRQDANAGESVQLIDIDDLDLDELKKRIDKGEELFFSGNDQEGTLDSIMEEFDDDEIIHFEHDEDDDDDDDDEAFSTDEVLQSIINDVDYDVDDDEMIELQMEMIEERLKELREERLKGGSIGDISPREGNKKKIPDFINDDNSELDEFLKEQNRGKFDSTSSSSKPPDWLSTRRSKLFSPTDMLRPDELDSARKADSEISIKKSTLLSSKEIIDCLSNLGAHDVRLITPDEKTLPYLGWDGLIIATGSSYSHIRVLTDAIVRNLRKRDLANHGVVGALHGSEGGEETSSFVRRRSGLPKRTDDGWIAVDCGNYIIHVQDKITRNSIDLEGLWSPGERGRAGRELRSLDPSDEEAVDDYVANNAVPDDYTQSLLNLSGNFWGADGQMRGGFGAFGKAKESNRWTSDRNEKRKFKNRGKGR